MKNRCLAVFATLMLMVGFVACRDKVPPYLVIKYIDDDEQDFHGKVIIGVKDPAEVPEHVKIPNGIVAIDSGAFKDCESIKTVTIPKSMKIIWGTAFFDCEDVEMTYKGTFKDWCAVEWKSRLFSGVKGVTLSNGTELRKLTKIDAGDLEGVTRIGSGAFYDCDSLENVTIPEGVTEIGWEAFYGCNSLKSVGIPKSMTEIDLEAFYGCNSLESVTIPKSVTKIGYDAFEYCENLDVTYKGTFKDWCAVDWDGSLLRSAKSITLSDGTDPRKLTRIDAVDLEGVTRIGREVFSHCASLESVTIPECVTEIGWSAFKYCESLKSVTIPKSMKKIDSYTFSGCKDFDVNYKGTFKDWCAMDMDLDLLENAKSITLSDGIDPRKLTKIDADDLKGVTRIGSHAFCHSKSLVSITIPDGVTEIGEYAFLHCKSLASVTIPESVTAISNSAFFGCKSLASVTIPEGVMAIGDIAFRDCTSLESVKIPESMKTIAYGAFKGCSSLKRIGIPSGVTEIGHCVFLGCTALESVIIPRSVTSIGGCVFADCSLNLKIQYDGTKAQWDAIDKESDNGNFVIQCTDGIVTN